MKTELEKLCIVAEACGWEFIQSHDNWKGVAEPDKWIHEDSETTSWEDCPIQATIDSIRSAVMQQSEEFQRKFNDALWKQVHTLSGPRFHQLTPSDWLNAFIETAEKTKTKTKT